MKDLTMKEIILNNIKNSVSAYVTQIVNALPWFLIFFIVLFFFYIFRKVLAKFLNKIKFNEFLEKIGVTDILAKTGIKKKASLLISDCVYYFLVLGLLREFSGKIGLLGVQRGVDAVIGFIPALIATIIILVFGSLFAQWFSRLVSEGAKNAGIDFANTLGNLAGAGLLFVVAVTALSQIGLSTEIVMIVTGCGLGGLALALALSFGLGSREITKNILAGFYARQYLNVGQKYEINGFQGELVSIGGTQFILENESTQKVLPNSHFLNLNNK